MLKIAICDDIIEITSHLEDIILKISKKNLINVDIKFFSQGMIY